MNIDLIKKTRVTSSIHFIKSNENSQDDSRRSSSGSKSVVCQNRRADRCYRTKIRSATVARDARTMIWIITDEERISLKQGSTTVKEGSTTTEKVFEEVIGGVEWWDRLDDVASREKEKSNNTKDHLIKMRKKRQSWQGQRVKYDSINICSTLSNITNTKRRNTTKLNHRRKSKKIEKFIMYRESLRQ